MTVEKAANFSFLSLAVIFIVSLIYIIFFAPKHIHSYHLGSESSTGLHIRVDVENAVDYTIPLIGVEYNEAISLVDSLNKTIPNRN